MSDMEKKRNKEKGRSQVMWKINTTALTVSVLLHSPPLQLVSLMFLWSHADLRKCQTFVVLFCLFFFFFFNFRTWIAVKWVGLSCPQNQWTTAKKLDLQNNFWTICPKTFTSLIRSNFICCWSTVTGQNAQSSTAESQRAICVSPKIFWLMVHAHNATVNTSTAPQRDALETEKFSQRARLKNSSSVYNPALIC